MIDPARSRADRPWWRDAVIYQVYIRSFADSDGDGIGDMEGIRSRLPYLEDLGVDAIWITPFYPSPMADGGYDVADYRDIEPLFGTLADADRLIADAHASGIRVVIDLVPNHTSDQHAWFREALASPPGSPARARYLFRKGRGRNGEQPPNDWRSVFGGPAWERVPDGEWYLHLFAVEQPDLDWSNPEVRAEFESVIRFWLDRGIDGFRIDVAHGLTKDPALPDLGDQLEIDGRDRGKRRSHPHWDRDELHDVYRAWRAIVDQYAHDPMFVAEAWVSTPERLARFVRSDELHTAFNFDLLEATWDAAKLRKAIDSSNAADRSRRRAVDVGPREPRCAARRDPLRRWRRGHPTGEGGPAPDPRPARERVPLPGPGARAGGSPRSPGERPRGPGVHPERRRATRQGRLSGTHPVDATGSLAGLRSGAGLAAATRCLGGQVGRGAGRGSRVHAGARAVRAARPSCGAGTGRRDAALARQTRATRSCSRATRTSSVP